MAAGSAFTQVLNPLSGRFEWKLMAEDYDYKQEIACSSYADMLHDKERNEKYYEGIKACIGVLQSTGQEVHVLDIGTGTGLLSMMAATCGADSIVACEAFAPVAECARKVLAANNFADKVRLINKRSTEMQVGEGKDMLRRANLLVTEVFDTELIGEGALETFIHARENLLTSDALIVPSEATIYAQVVSSNILLRWNQLNSIYFESPNGRTLVKIPTDIHQCAGAASVHDIQLSEVPKEWFTPISEPLPVFRFDWSGRYLPLRKKEVMDIEFQAKAKGKCGVILMWWELEMDPDSRIVLSCAPHWAHPDTAGKIDSSSRDIPWRDHWMQALYYLPKPIQMEKDDQFKLVSFHDEYSLWFHLRNTSDRDCMSLERPTCTCGLHTATSRTRLGRFNDPRYSRFFPRILSYHINRETVCLALGDFCILGLVAVKMGAKHVYLIETNNIKRKLMEDFIEVNDLSDKITVFDCEPQKIKLEQLIAPITLVFSEPYFDSSLLPWHSLYHWYLRKDALHLFHENVTFLPKKLSIKALPVHFRDLWKIRAPIGFCSGFDVSHFDEVIRKALEATEEKVEPQPLWEYRTYGLGQPATLLSVELTKETPTVLNTQTCLINVEESEPLNGLALWADWHFGTDDEDVFTTGPLGPIYLNQQVLWDVYIRQGIYLFKRNAPSYAGVNEIKAVTTFNPSEGAILFDFILPSHSASR